MAGPFGAKFTRARNSSSSTFRTSNGALTSTFHKAAVALVATPETTSGSSSSNSLVKWPPPVRFVTTPATDPLTTPEEASWSSCSTQDDSIPESLPRRTLFHTQSLSSSPQLRSRKSIECSDEDFDDEDEPTHNPWFVSSRSYHSSKSALSTNHRVPPLTALVPWLLALVSLTSVSMIFIMNHNVGSTAQHDVFILHTSSSSSSSAQTLRRPPGTNLHQLALKPSHLQQHHESSLKHSQKKSPKTRTTSPRRHHKIQKPTGILAAAPWPLDASLYKETTSTESEITRPELSYYYPRIVQLHKSVKFASRDLDVDASPYTDETQIYDHTDSRDTPTMERAPPLLRLNHKNDHAKPSTCQPMADWQTTVYPSCNSMHEIQLEQLTLFGMKGFWRNAWRYDQHDETVVLKTLRINHRFEEAYYENNRIDAVVLERLTASPHVINVFGFCGNSVLTEFADGKRLGELADKKRNEYGARLRIARDIASGLRDVHTIDYANDSNATFVHMDINPANVVSIGGTLKLNDFNIGVPRLWNTTSNKPCGIPTKYPNPQWRSPEEAAGSNALTEKIDVFSLGHILFRLICGHEPWHKLEPGGVLPSKDILNEKVKRGILPTIPEPILESNDPEIVAIRTAMLRCYTFDPEKRPSAREIADSLQLALDNLPELSTKLLS